MNIVRPFKGVTKNYSNNLLPPIGNIYITYIVILAIHIVVIGEFLHFYGALTISTGEF